MAKVAAEVSQHAQDKEDDTKSPASIPGDEANFCRLALPLSLTLK